MTDTFDIDPKAARAFLAAKKARRKQLLEKLFQEATDGCARIARHIIARYRPRCIWQWGSLLNPEKFSEISDIDLALEGLAGPQQFFAALGDAMNMTKFPVDIVELEKIGLENAQYIRNTGKLLFSADWSTTGE